MKITICRCGEFPAFNKKKRGLFYKEFKDLEEFVKFYWDTYPALYYPNLRDDISRRDLEILRSKLTSYHSKHISRSNSINRRSRDVV